MSSIRTRLFIIAGLVLLSIWAIIPRDKTVRRPDETGRMRDVTVRQVPINLGLDLQGGIHLALEVDETKGAVADHIYLIDPLGNLMMRYPRDPEPARIIKDLQRLLKYSRIG